MNTFSQDNQNSTVANEENESRLSIPHMQLIQTLYYIQNQLRVVNTFWQDNQNSTVANEENESTLSIPHMQLTQTLYYIQNQLRVVNTFCQDNQNSTPSFMLHCTSQNYHIALYLTHIYIYLTHIYWCITTVYKIIIVYKRYRMFEVCCHKIQSLNHFST